MKKKFGREPTARKIHQITSNFIHVAGEAITLKIRCCPNASPVHAKWKSNFMYSLLNLKMLRMRRQLRQIVEYIILNVFVIAMSSCQQSEPMLNKGQAYVTATDGEINDTLRVCYCWQTEDSLNIHITRGPYMGISIDLTE
jgi:hypothetical protein